MVYALGVDIGGTKIAAALICENGSVLFRNELPSVTEDKEGMFRQVVRSIDQVLKTSGESVHKLMGIGLGVPGKINQEQGVAVLQNNLPWRNFPIVERVKGYYSIDNVVLDNDVYMAAFGEWSQYGKEKNETFVYLTISTGISCSIIHKGEFLRGAGFAGELGLSVVTDEGLQGNYQNNGCLEAVASGVAIKNRMIEKLKDAGKSAESMSTKKVIEDYWSNDPYAVEVMNGVIRNLSRGVQSIICLLDPHKVVLGGGVISHNPGLMDPIKEELQTLLIPEQMDALDRLYLSQLKGDVGLIGAGYRVFDEVN
ncbi:ROK family protein [Pseudalkalibacillus decolorationis]|uniref:ROK family protein n=1 Tax=Pseudalkalibacillus decolorationis TaxID=163879 RepID=UPI0021480CE3|nr:ROK family protein [Pseudalkalibacillus decolorationis]